MFLMFAASVIVVVVVMMMAGGTTQKTAIFIPAAMRNSNLKLLFITDN
jgi:hypothetical protein